MASNPWQDTIDWVTELLSHAFGTGTPEEGMKASAILFAITFASNAIGLWFTIVLDVMFAILFAYNLFRYVWGEVS